MEETNSKNLSSENSKNNEEEKEVEVKESFLEKVKKTSFLQDASLVPMTIAEERLDYIDTATVNKQYYNNFNFSKLSKRFGDFKVSLGVTSANKGEGKTHVASNMAVSLAKAYRQRTVLVDMNFKNPQLHKIFGARREPGLADAMQTRMVRVSSTRIEDLYLLPAGDSSQYLPGIKDTIALREILYTLKNEFDFIIVDMSSIFPVEEFPIHFINEIDGLLTVIDAKKTRHEHLKNIYKHVDENRFVGYIFNRVSGKR